VDPGATSEPDATPEPEPKRGGWGAGGRRRGAGRRRASQPGSSASREPRAPTLSARIKQLEQLLVGTHASLAAYTGHDHWAIGDDEAKEVSSAALAIMAHYNIRASQKTMDWLAFCWALGHIYAPRIGMSVALQSADRQPAAPPAGATVPL